MTRAYKIGPSNTPTIIKALISISAIVSVISAIFSPLTHHLNLFSLFSLSLIGIQKGFFWQLITNFFMIDGVSVNINFLIHLIFNLYILWIFGTSFIERQSVKKFVSLYFISGILSSLAALFVMYLLHPYYFFSANFIVLFSILTAWMKLNPHAQFHILHSIPLKANWIIIGLISLNLLIDLSHYDFVSLSASIVSIATGFLYSLIFIKNK